MLSSRSCGRVGLGRSGGSGGKGRSLKPEDEEGNLKIRARELRAGQDTLEVLRATHKKVKTSPVDSHSLIPYLKEDTALLILVSDQQ